MLKSKMGVHYTLFTTQIGTGFRIDPGRSTCVLSLAKTGFNLASLQKDIPDEETFSFNKEEMIKSKFTSKIERTLCF